MRKLLYLSGALILMGVITTALTGRALWIAAHPTVPVADALGESSARGAPTKIPLPKFKVDPAKPAAMTVTLPASVNVLRDVTIGKTETPRRDEDPGRFAARRQWVDAYRAFVKDAHLTEQQETELRKAMIDTQMNHFMGRAAIKQYFSSREAQKDFPSQDALFKARGQALQELFETGQAALDQRLKTILTPDQRGLLSRGADRYSNLGLAGKVYTLKPFEPTEGID